MSEKPTSIAVMPFRNLSREPDTEYFANGFVEDLTAELTRFPSLRVLATQSTFTLAQLDRTADQRVQEWGLDYVLRGSIRRGDNQVRVGVQLIRTQDRETVWADRFDAPLNQVFDIQDQITATVAGRMAVQVDEARLKDARGRLFDDLPAYECWLRGMDCLKRGSLEGDEESREYFKQSLQIDPNYARAYAGLSLSHFNEWTCRAWHLWDENEHNAYDYATKAVQIDDRDAMVQSVLARVCRFRRQHAEADQHAERALMLNSNDPHVLIQVSIVELFGGNPERGLELALRAIDLNPLHGDWYHGIAGWNLFFMKRYDDAFPLFERAGDAITDFAAYRAACAVVAGDLPGARSDYEAFQQQYRQRISFGREPVPGEALTWAVQVEPFRRAEDSRHMPDILRDASLAEIDVEQAIQSRPKQMVHPAAISSPGGNKFRCESGVWSVAYDGSGARLVELKGFHDIARLLSQPDQPLHCLELSGQAASFDAPADVLDEQARREYRRRIEELQQEIEQAEFDNNPARAEPARVELDAIIDQLASATGLGGRDRKLGNPAERARSAVTWRIRSAIKKIRAAHPRLGQHFSNSIRTGNFCVYSPESTKTWEL
jgi:TolB-like protein/tetratricopeptide (TPR) repeat protein